jgi:hypothetical protein
MTFVYGLERWPQVCSRLDSSASSRSFPFVTLRWLSYPAFVCVCVCVCVESRIWVQASGHCDASASWYSFTCYTKVTRLTWHSSMDSKVDLRCAADSNPVQVVGTSRLLHTLRLLRYPACVWNRGAEFKRAATATAEKGGTFSLFLH